MSNQDKFSSLSYKQSGVDIEQANTLVHTIKQIARRTHRPGVLGNLGGFGALFEIPSHYNTPVLVSGTDGVGTKLKLAIEMNKNDTIGIDLVAMCANDILTLGAEPLYFLDYFATSALNTRTATDIVSGIGKGCELAHCALIGGETAEMPGLYQDNEYDLAGFCVGVAEKDKLIDGSLIKPGDAIIGLTSSGVHANGFSLVRKVIERTGSSLNDAFNGTTLGATLLEPTRIYVANILSLCNTLPVHGLVHITGGGLVENIPRVLPTKTQATLDCKSWAWPAIFKWIQEHGQIELHEMYRTFNLGVGMIAIVDKNHVKKALHHLQHLGETAWQIGTIASSNEEQPTVNLS